MVGIRPDVLASSILLAGDHAAGVLLYKILYWSKYARVELPNSEGTWIANPHEFWRQQCVMSKRQCERAIARLSGRGLIEKRQWWFGKRLVLHTRPSQLTRDFLDAAATWDAAYELLSEFEGAAEDGNPTSPVSDSSNGTSEGGTPTLPISAKSKTSKHYKHSYGVKKEIHQGAALAAPSSATEHTGEINTNTSPGEMVKITHPGEMKKIGTTSSKGLCTPSLNSMVEHWTEQTGLSPTAKEVGSLAQVREYLAHCKGADGPVDLSGEANAIISFAIEHWIEFLKQADLFVLKKNSPPSPSVLSDKVHLAASMWLEHTKSE